MTSDIRLKWIWFAIDKVFNHSVYSSEWVHALLFFHTSLGIYGDLMEDLKYLVIPNHSH